MSEEYPDPNGPAITRGERRNGVPLDYVASKIEPVIKNLHRAIGLVDARVPADLEMGGTYPPGFKVQVEIAGEMREAFVNAVVSYLALNNMLGLTNENEKHLMDRLVGMTPEQLGEWISRIAASGHISEVAT